MTIKGPANQGSAGVFGTGVNPLSVYMQYQQRRAQNEYLQYQEERKKRDKLFDYVGTYNSDAKWEQYQAEVNNMAQTEVRDWTANELNSGRDANQIQAELGFRQGRVKSFAAETGVWKTTHDDAYKTITGDAKYNEEATSALNDIFFNANGGKRTPDEVRRDIQGIDHSIIFNPKFFNETVVAKKFMDTLEEQARTTWGTISKADGTYMTSQEIQGKLPYQYDKDGVIMLDHHTLKPLMKMTDDLYTLVKGSQDMRLLMESKGGDTRAGQEEYLKRLLPGLDKSSVKEGVKEGFKKTELDRKAEWAKWGWGYNVDPADLMNRHDLLKEITDKYTPETLGIFNHTTKDVQVQYSNFKTDAKGNKIPTEIDISYPSKLQDENMTPAEKKEQYKAHVMGESPLKLRHEKMKIETEAEKQAARVVLSEHLDQYDQKRSLGDQYAKFENEMKDKRLKGGIKYTAGKPIF